MSIPNHQTIVEQVHMAHPPEPTEDGLVAFLLRLIAALPASEHAGLLRKDAGENIGWYEPAQVHVSLSRVCYPDGHIVKVLADAGANPASGNRPTWGDSGEILDLKFYVAVKSGEATPPPPSVNTNYDDHRVVAFELDVRDLLPNDPGRVGVEGARLEHDANVGEDGTQPKRPMGYAAAHAKHLALLKKELGLP